MSTPDQHRVRSKARAMTCRTSSSLAAVLALCLTAGAVDAHAADQIVKRIRTTRTQVAQHIRDTPGYRGSEDAPASSLTVGTCRGYHFNRARKAKTWRCTYTYTISGYHCTGSYHGGYVRFRSQDGRLGVRWQDDQPAKTCSNT